MSERTDHVIWIGIDPRLILGGDIVGGFITTNKPNPIIEHLLNPETGEIETIGNKGVKVKEEKVDVLEYKIGNETVFKCKRCKKLFYIRNSLRRHEKADKCIFLDAEDYIRPSLQPHPCNYCNKILKDRACLRDHLKTHHITERKYMCEQCEQKFVDVKTLNRHIKLVHSGEGNHPCDSCNDVFTRRRFLKVHKDLVHTKELYHCDVCSQEFKSTVYLNNHKKKIHNNNAPYCFQCDEKFSDQTSLYDHYNNGNCSELKPDMKNDDPLSENIGLSAVSESE